MAENISEIIATIVNADPDERINLLNSYADELESGTSAALILEALPIEGRIALWRQLPQSLSIEILTAMRADARNAIIRDLSETELNQLFTRLDNSDLIDWSDSLKEELIEQALEQLGEEESELFVSADTYDVDEIGRYADRKIIILPRNATVAVALQTLSEEISATKTHIYLVDRRHRYLGFLQVSDLLGHYPQTPLIKLADTETSPLSSRTGLLESAEQIEHSDSDALPVVNSQRVLLGELSIRLGLTLIREEYENTLMASAGLREHEDLFSPMLSSARRRALWLGVNLLTAILASITIGMFEDVITKVVALAVLMPIVASMGGIAGSQTLTLMIRAMALNQVNKGNLLALLKNECGIGALNGLLWSLVIGIIAGLWFQSATLSLIIAIAIAVNLCCAALCGVLIPVLLEKMELDPALAGSVILTTVTDVVGFFAFLGTATLLYSVMI